MSDTVTESWAVKARHLIESLVQQMDDATVSWHPPYDELPDPNLQQGGVLRRGDEVYDVQLSPDEEILQFEISLKLTSPMDAKSRRKLISAICSAPGVELGFDIDDLDADSFPIEELRASHPIDNDQLSLVVFDYLIARLLESRDQIELIREYVESVDDG